MIETSVILLTYNGEKYLNKCIESLRKQTYKDFEIIMVDNLSKDESVELVRKKFPEVRIIENNRNLGYARGNNEGVEHAKGNFVVLLNQDTFADKNYLKELVGTIKSDNKIGTCQPKVLIMEQEDKINSVELTTNFLGFSWCGSYLSSSENFKETKEICFSSGAASIYRKDLYTKVGGLDEDYFTYHEDTDFGWKARLLGYKAYLNPNSIIYHDYSFGRNPGKIYHEEKNRLMTILKNYEKRTLFLLFPMIIFSEGGIIAYSLISGFFKEKIKGYLYLMKNKNLILSKREFIQKKRKVRDRDIINFFEDEIDFKEIENPILRNIFNPIMSFYWGIVKKFI